MINDIEDLRDLRVTSCDLRLIAKTLKAVLASDGAVSNESTVATAAGTYLMTSKAIGPVNGSTVASLRSQADDRVSRDLDRANLKRPGRGVPPPRSGPAPYVVCGLHTRATHLPTIALLAWFGSHRCALAKTAVPHGVRRDTR
jgi:hypothetical protein